MVSDSTAATAMVATAPAATAPAAPPRVYRLSPLRRVILDGAATAIFAVPAGLVVGKAVPVLGAALLLLCLAPALAILLFSAWYPRLIVAPEGLRVRGAIGYSSLLIPWKNIERVWLRPNKEGLVLREPLESKSAARWKNWTNVSFLGGKFFDDEQQVYIDKQRYVPLVMFAYWLRHGELAAELTGYAPWLAAELQAQDPAYRKEQSAYNRKIMWVFVMSAVIMACTYGWAAYHGHQPPAQQAKFAKGEQFLDRFADWAFALSLSLYALLNIRAAMDLLRRKQPGYAAFWFLYAVIQILLVFGIMGS